MFLSSNNKINITLCGMMGSGKSIIGKKLAKEIDFKFLDTDKFIEDKVGKSINKIFIEDGETFFRKLEEKMILEILKNKKTVIALGGGSIVNKIIRDSIKNNSYNIYLDVNIDILVKRLKNSKNRPLIRKKNIYQTIEALINKRKKFYNRADLIIKNEISVNNIIKIILKKLNSYD